MNVIRFRKSWLYMLFALSATTAHADLNHPKESDSLEDLARVAQNPIANLISVPFQNNFQILEGGAVLN